MDNKNENKKYVERAADILADLVRKSRSKLPSPEKEAEHFKEELRSVGKIDQVFKENSQKLIDMIRKQKGEKKDRK